MWWSRTSISCDQQRYQLIKYVPCLYMSISLTFIMRWTIWWPKFPYVIKSMMILCSERERRYWIALARTLRTWHKNWLILSKLCGITLIRDRPSATTLVSTAGWATSTTSKALHSKYLINSVILRILLNYKASSTLMKHQSNSMKQNKLLKASSLNIELKSDAFMSFMINITST